MKFAATAARRGHVVTLHEKAAQLGGQVQLAQGLPGREDFGGLTTNLVREMELAGVKVVLNSLVDAELVRRIKPDAAVIATGATPHLPANLELDGAHAASAWDILRNNANVGSSVVVADWRSDWIGLGVAEALAAQGCRVTLCTNAAMAGETLQLYTRNHYVGRLHKLGVNIRTHLRLFGADEDTVYFADTLTGDAVQIEETDTLVLSLGHVADADLEHELTSCGVEVLPIGDCVVPRSAEEAVYEGFELGWTI